MDTLKFHSATGQAAYHDLLRMLRDDAVSDLRGEPTLKPHGDRRYWYDQYRIGTQVHQRYIGKDNSETRRRLARTAEISAGREDARRERARLVRLLRAEGLLPVVSGTGSS